MMIELLVGKLKDGSFLEKRRFFIGNYHDYFLLLLGLNAEDVFVVNLIIKSGEVGLRQVVVKLHVLHLFF